ncbi:hypothetical protein [Streptomyces sp. cmx-4-9]|uniref:hypothetical protein n=1 Tax=Streptomyces sp. cmx-4-9 TaxID=2790941 RepID=UPI00397F19C5
MAEAVPVRCPGCRRENSYTSPVFPCACGSPVVPPLDLTAPPEPLTHRTWSDAWVAVRCTSCGRESEWPHPEVGCPSCGTVVRLPVHPLEPAAPAAGAGAAVTGAGTATGAGAGAEAQRHAEPAGEAATGTSPAGSRPPTARQRPLADRPGRRPTGSGTGPAASGSGSGRPAGGAEAEGAGAAPARPPFRPVTIRTARDAVATAALYLRWLGFRDVRQPDARPIPSAVVDLRAPGLVAQVDPTTSPAGLRAVECVWLNGLTASATSVYFSLAGYTEDARTRADDLGIPLFVMDLTGMPLPVNDPADELVGAGA